MKRRLLPLFALFNILPLLSLSVLCKEEKIPPRADAGEDITAAYGEIVYLDGSRSSQGSGGALGYAWIQKDGPDVLISDKFSATPHFTAPSVPIDPPSITFILYVKNDAGFSFDEVKVNFVE